MDTTPILDRLDGVRRVRDGEYIARCPSHDDRRPSLSVKDGGDRVLVICRAGCTFDDIRSSLGMQAHEFFEDGRAPKLVAPGVNRRELAEALTLELSIAYIVTCDRAKGREISDADRERELVARDRIRAAWRVAT